MSTHRRYLALRSDEEMIESLVAWLSRTGAPWHADRLREWGEMCTVAASEVVIPPFLRRHESEPEPVR